MALEHTEKRYLDMEWSDATKAEKRNTEWAQWPDVITRLRKWRKSPENAQKFADRIINFGQRHYYGSTWVPQNLKAGDIVRADLPTDFQQNGVPELWPRNCLVLGLDLDAETLDLKSVRLCPFSYQFTANDDRYEPVFPAAYGADYVRSPLGRQAVLRTGRMDVVPPENMVFGFYIDRVPAVRATDMAFYQDYLNRGYEHGRIDRNFMLKDSEGTIFVPSLDPADWKTLKGFTLPEHNTPLYQGTLLSDMDELARYAGR